MMRIASLKVIKAPHTHGYVIAWDGKTVASSCLAELANEAFNKKGNRISFLEYLEEAKNPDTLGNEVHSGNGLNMIAAGEFAYFNHDYFPEKQAFMRISDVLQVLAWVESLEQLGFPNADIPYPDHDFGYMSDDKSAEAEFRMASGIRN